MTFDFDSIKEKLLEKLSSFSSLTITVLQTSVYGTVLDVIAYAIDKLAFYFEFLYRESVWGKAQLRKSLVAQSYLLNYKPKRKRGANGQVRVIGNKNYINYKSLTPSPIAYVGEPVQFYRWDKLSSEDGNTVVYCIEDKLYAGSYQISQKSLQNLSIAQVAGSADYVKITFPSPHGVPLGAMFSIRGTKNYNGEFLSIDSPPDSNTSTIVFEAIYTPESFGSNAYLYTGHIYLKVKEGNPKEFEYTALGNANETIEIVGESIDNDEIQVLEVDPVTNQILNEYEIVDELYLVNDDTPYKCSIRNSDDFNALFIVFGDGVRSRKILSGEKILVKYAETRGDQGNINNTSIIVKPLTSKLSIFGNPSTLSYTNDEEISDGNDLETVESIRINGKNLFFAGNRADTRQDYVSIIQQHPSVHKALVFTEADLNNLTITGNQSTVYISALSKSGNQLTVAQQEDISVNYLNDHHAITDILSWQPIKIVNARPFIDAKINPVPIDQAKSEIFTILSDTYSSLKTDFNKSIFFSNMNSLIDLTDSVIYHNTELFHCEKSENFPDLQLTTANYQIATSVSSGEESDPKKIISIQADSSLKVLIKIKTNGVWGNEILVGYGQSTGPESGNIITALPNDPLITAQSGITFDPMWGIDSGGAINGDDIVATNANKTVFTLLYDVYSGNLIFTNPSSPFFGYVLNPTEADENGLVIRLMYKTRNNDSPQMFTNDIRMKRFNIITDLRDDDIIYRSISS
jgi:hypothetical protein